MMHRQSGTKLISSVHTRERAHPECQNSENYSERRISNSGKGTSGEERTTFGAEGGLRQRDVGAERVERVGVQARSLGAARREDAEREASAGGGVPLMGTEEVRALLGSEAAGRTCPRS